MAGGIECRYVLFCKGDIQMNDWDAELIYLGLMLFMIYELYSNYVSG